MSPSVKPIFAQDSMEPATRDLLAWLGRGATYPDHPAEVQVIETHISWVFLTRRFAYKLKKPVSFDFLDFQTPEARRDACYEELRLNRRLTPEVYLGVVPISRHKQGPFCWNDGSEPVDWLVKMRRLPERQRLDRRLAQGQITTLDVENIGRTLGEFFQGLPPLTLRPADYLATLEHHLRDNRRALLSFDPSLSSEQVRRVHHDQLRLLKLASEQLVDRVCDGRIVEGHGDLRPEHIYLNSHPAIIDCIEFNQEYRRLDVADELCFLAMECDRLGAPLVGDKILHLGLGLAGDRPDPSLLRFYKSYRACVRAKVAALRSRQEEAAARGNSIELARRYLRLADGYRDAAHRPALVIVGGLMGTGKTTLSEEVAQGLGMELLSTDVVRRQTLGPSSAQEPYAAGRYTPELRKQVYQRLFYEADHLLDAGISVVLDGTFTSRAARDQVIELTQAHDAVSLLVHCECPAEVARERIAQRVKQGTSLSEARPELLAAQAEEDSPLREETGNVVHVDTTASLNAQVTQVYERLGTLVHR